MVNYDTWNGRFPDSLSYADLTYSKFLSSDLSEAEKEVFYRWHLTEGPEQPFWGTAISDKQNQLKHFVQRKRWIAFQLVHYSHLDVKYYRTESTEGYKKGHSFPGVEDCVWKVQYSLWNQQLLSHNSWL